MPTPVTPRSGGSAGSGTPYGGNAAVIPGTIQAERYDFGGEGVAYSDTDPGNNGGVRARRYTDVFTFHPYR